MGESLIDFVASRPADEPAAATLAAWRADATTVRPIPLGPLTAYLRAAGLDDVLAAAVASESAPADARAGLRRFLAHVADQRQSTLDTTDPAVAGQTAAVLAGLAKLLPDGGAGILALGGGLRHGPAAEQGVTDARAVADRRAALATLRARVGGTAATFLNETLAAAERDATLPVPTWEQYLATLAVAAEPNP